jgi:CHAT domain-containing protein
MVDSYDITYAYSGTLLSETKKVSRKLRNSALVFAPEYRGDIYVDSIMVSRQLSGEMLDRIPGAREEAINVNRILGGDLFLDVDATESRFKERASEGDVIHLAMHTLLNDAEPMYSKMVFYLDDDGPNDGKLNTYEVYNIPLNAKMVVLSSCNTGSGYLQSGEGVMSLARGFFYSGSPAVVMSLWEVDDRSGSQIVGKFYSNLQKGYSKSKSLRRARITYLKEADQMRSHPYFWCTTVIMGDDSPIFYSRVRIGMIILLGIALILGIYFRQRIRSS